MATMLVLAWGALSFGAVYVWAYWPLAAACLVCGMSALTRRIPAPRVPSRLMAVSLVAVATAMVLQIVPLPINLLATLSPRAGGLLSELDILFAAGALQRRSLSIVPAATVTALVLYVALAVMMLGVARSLSANGPRRIAALITGLGVLLALIGIMQQPFYDGRIYGFWTPLDTGALPYGPFVNRNHCATWLLMGIPLCFGYLMARLANERAPSESLRHTFDARTVWLATAGTAMVLALAWSFSRSGIAAFAVSSVVMVGATRARLDPLRTVWVAGLALLGLAAVITLADVGAVLNRFADGIGAGRLGRLAIWRDTLPVIADFFVTGSGIGTYQTAMLIYQSGDRTYYYNQAHNEILQVASEGGLLIVLPAAIALAAFVGVAARRLKADGTGIFWIRAGAAAGLASVALQSVWETGLRVPANALLAAVLAAILTHQQREAMARRPGRRP